MQDKETGTLWSHITGEALDGPMKGQFLETIPSVQTTWAEWFVEHPATELLKKEQEVTSSHYERYFRNPDRMGMFNVEWLRERLPGKSKVYGISVGPFALAVAEKKMETEPLLNVMLGEDPVVVFKSSDGGIRAYISSADTVTLVFDLVGEGLEIHDQQTGSMWDLTQGTGTGGRYEGTRLEEIKVLPIFWFAWSNFYPRTDVID